jgi:hypothetical protein
MSSILSFNQYLLLNPLNEATSNEATTVINSFYSAVKSTQVEESPRGSNKGPKVEPLQKGVRANPGDPWCAADVYGVLSKDIKVFLNVSKDKKDLSKVFSYSKFLI